MPVAGFVRLGTLMDVLRNELGCKTRKAKHLVYSGEGEVWHQPEWLVKGDTSHCPLHVIRTSWSAPAWSAYSKTGSASKCQNISYSRLGGPDHTTVPLMTAHPTSQIPDSLS